MKTYITASTTDVQDDVEVVKVTQYDELPLTGDEKWNLFQGTLSNRESVTKWLKANLQALWEEPFCLQEPANIMHVQIHDGIDANFPLKISGINVIALYDTDTNISLHMHAIWN